MKKFFKKRWDNLSSESLSEILKVAAPAYQDPDVYFQELIMEEKNEKVADRRLKVIEKLLIEDEAEKLEIDMERIRIERDRMLSLSDFSQIADVPLTQDERKAYRQYRRYLRELPVLIQRGQVVDMRVMDFRDWRKTPVVFKGWDS